MNCNRQKIPAITEMNEAILFSAWKVSFSFVGASTMLIKKTKKGRKYFGCENNPDKCEFVSWNKPVEKKCPKCGSYMVEKGTKNVKLLCSNEKCGYSEDKEQQD